ITDEDVADDNDIDEIDKVNTAHFDGRKTTITISSDAGVELLESVPEYLRAAHHTCAADAKTVQAHARCVVVLLDAELKYQKWNTKFGNAKRIVFGDRAEKPKRRSEEVAKLRQKQYNVKKEYDESLEKAKLGQHMRVADRMSKRPQMDNVSCKSFIYENLLEQNCSNISFTFASLPCNW
ncbi:unnamed protein product, partial [Strongylus vulgaris]